MKARGLLATVCVLVGAVAGYVLPRMDSAEAGTQRLLCIGDTVVLSNPTDERIGFTTRSFQSDGDLAGTSTFHVDPRHTYEAEAPSSTVRSVIVEATGKGLRVLGLSLASSGSRGYSECVRVK